jgi:hypothetical protein
MSTFHLGLVVGFFLGSLVMLVVLGVLHLYLAERQAGRAAAEFSDSREIQAGHRQPPDLGCQPCRPCLTLAPERPFQDAPHYVCYLFIVIE